MRQGKPEPKLVRMMDQHYPKRRDASLAVVVPILVIGWSGMRPAVRDELMLKWVSAALALGLIAAFAWAHPLPDPSNAPNGWICIRMEIAGVRP
jgi:hypothetical protein